MNVEMTQLIGYAIAGVATIIGAVATAIINSRVKDAQMRGVLENGLKNSLGYLQKVLQDGIDTHHIAIPNVPISIAPAVQYVVDHVPEALDHFGLTPEAIAQKILARIGVQNIETNKAIAASPSPEIPAPLAPVPASVTLHGPAVSEMPTIPKEN